MSEIAGSPLSFIAASYPVHSSTIELQTLTQWKLLPAMFTKVLGAFN